MTVANPLGAIVDVGRSCYESDMMVPEFNTPIRVRWYQVPKVPGTYPLTDYSSSDWDESPHSNDPTLGEQSSTRNPWLDWRDCSPPPFGPPVGCPALPKGGKSAYCIIVRVGNANVTLTMNFQGHCTWSGMVSGEPIFHITWTGGLSVGSRVQTLTVRSVGALGVGIQTFQSVGDWNGSDPLVMAQTSGVDAGGPRQVTACGFDEDLGMLVGQVIFDAGVDGVPPKWLLCNGSAVSRMQYGALFARVGTTYGPGDGSTTFNLPDLRDRVAVGSGVSYGTGQVVGEASHVLLATEMPTHTHTVTDPGHHHASPDGNHFGTVPAVGVAGAGAVVVATDGGSQQTANSPTGITLQNAGGGVAHNNLQPSVGLRPLIYAGV